MGDVGHRKDAAVLLSLKITHIIDLSLKYKIKLDHIKYLEIDIMDDDDVDILSHFNKCITFIDSALKSKNNIVFVHCSAGVSRSSTIIMAYLMKSQKYNLFNAYKHVLQCRECISPNDGFYKQLCKYEIQLYGKSTDKLIQNALFRK